LAILLSLALPRFLATRKNTYKAEIMQVLNEAKTMSWAYFQEYNAWPDDPADIGLQMPVGSAWNPPNGQALGGAGNPRVRWTASGIDGDAKPVDSTDRCSIALWEEGNTTAGCNF
jgi:hypothetical protein